MSLFFYLWKYLQLDWPLPPRTAKSIQQNHTHLVADKLNESCHDWHVPFFCMSIWHKTYTVSTSSTEKKLPVFLFAYSLDYPVLLAEGTAIILFHPQGHAAIVEGMIAFSPNHWKRRKNTFQSHSAVQSTPTARSKLSSQMFITTASFRDETGHHWFIHWD